MQSSLSQNPVLGLRVSGQSYWSLGLNEFLIICADQETNELLDGRIDPVKVKDGQWTLPHLG